MKLGPVTKLDKRNKKKNYVNMSVKFIFSLVVTFYLTKTENGTKKSQTQLSHYCFE